MSQDEPAPSLGDHRVIALNVCISYAAALVTREYLCRDARPSIAAEYAPLMFTIAAMPLRAVIKHATTTEPKLALLSFFGSLFRGQPVHDRYHAS